MMDREANVAGSDRRRKEPGQQGGWNPPRLPHGLSHISELTAVLVEELKRQYPEYEELESND